MVLGAFLYYVYNFNTTLVSVQYIFSIGLGGLHSKFQYNPCVGSIIKTIPYTPIVFWFQYNPCVGSIFVTYATYTFIILFQYNPCVGSISMGSVIWYFVTQFQYNPCVGSIKKDLSMIDLIS